MKLTINLSSFFGLIDHCTFVCVGRVFGYAVYLSEIIGGALCTFFILFGIKEIIRIMRSITSIFIEKLTYSQISIKQASSLNSIELAVKSYYLNRIIFLRFKKKYQF